jgi:hypothetical protein
MGAKPAAKETTEEPAMDVVSSPAQAPARLEQPWTSLHQEHMQECRDRAEKMSREHNEAGYNARRKDRIFSIPPPILSLIVAAVAQLWDSPDNVYIVVILSLVGGVISVVGTTLNMAGKAERHWRFASHYTSTKSKIDDELVQAPEHRVPADKFMTEVRLIMDALQTYEPQLPGGGFFGCKRYKDESPLPPPTARSVEPNHYQIP